MANKFSCEFLAVRKSNVELIDCATMHYDGLCDRLFADGYITTSVRNFVHDRSTLREEKARKLIDTIIDMIEMKPNVFYDLVKILKDMKESILSDVILKLEGDLSDEKDTKATPRKLEASSNSHDSSDSSYHSANSTFTDSIKSPDNGSTLDAEETQVVIRDTYTEPIKHCPLNKTVSGVSSVSSASSGYSSTRDSTISDNSRYSRISSLSSFSYPALADPPTDSPTATSDEQYRRDGSASPLVKNKRKYHTATYSEYQMPSRSRSTAFTNKTKSEQGMELEKSRCAAKIKALDKIPPKK